MLYGKVDLNGNKNVKVGTEFEDGLWGKKLVLHLPKDAPTCNWYHGVKVCSDLDESQYVDNSLSVELMKESRES